MKATMSYKLDNNDVVSINDHIIKKEKGFIWERSKHREVSGLYKIYDRKGLLLYIGKTNNFKNRLTSHRNGNSGTERLVDYLYSVEMFEFDDNICRDICEILLVSKEKPLLNNEFRYNYEAEVERYYRERENCCYNEWSDFEKIAKLKLTSLTESLIFTYWCRENNLRIITGNDIDEESINQHFRDYNMNVNNRLIASNTIMNNLNGEQITDEIIVKMIAKNDYQINIIR